MAAFIPTSAPSVIPSTKITFNKTGVSLGSDFCSQSKNLKGGFLGKKLSAPSKHFSADDSEVEVEISSPEARLKEIPRGLSKYDLGALPPTNFFRRAYGAGLSSTDWPATFEYRNRGGYGGYGDDYGYDSYGGYDQGYGGRDMYGSRSYYDDDRRRMGGRSSLGRYSRYDNSYGGKRWMDDLYNGGGRRAAYDDEIMGRRGGYGRGNNSYWNNDPLGSYGYDRYNEGYGGDRYMDGRYGSGSMGYGMGGGRMGYAGIDLGMGGGYGYGMEGGIGGGYGYGMGGPMGGGGYGGYGMGGGGYGGYGMGGGGYGGYGMGGGGYGMGGGGYGMGGGW